LVAKHLCRLIEIDSVWTVLYIETAAADASMQAATEPKTAALNTQSKPGKVLSKADMLAKISQAKAYKLEKEAKPGMTPAIIPAQSTEAAQQQHQQGQQAAHQPKDSFSATQRRPARQEANEPGALVEEAQVENSGVGSASQAAGYLQQAVRGTDASKGMRMETYSVLKEQEMRKQKVGGHACIHPGSTEHAPHSCQHDQQMSGVATTSV
jgi:hypothetical protein